MNKRPSLARKKPYNPPRLLRYGDLRTLTQGGGRKVSETGSTGPKTRAVGTA